MADAHVLLESIFNTACIIEDEVAGENGKKTKNLFHKIGDLTGTGYDRLKSGASWLGSKAKSGASWLGSKAKSGATATGQHLSRNKRTYIGSLLSAGAAGAGTYAALRNKLFGADDDSEDNEA